MRLPFRKAAPPPEPVPTELTFVAEVPESALPTEFKELVWKASREASEAMAQINGLFSRVSDLEMALEDPALGLPRVRALEVEFDRLANLLSSSVNLHFERKQPKG
jgi:hypothetical protein